MVNYDVERGISVYTTNGPDKTQSRFNIREATPRDSGNYTCKPSNTMPASIQVFVSKGRGMYVLDAVASFFPSGVSCQEVVLVSEGPGLIGLTCS